MFICDESMQTHTITSIPEPENDFLKQTALHSLEKTPFHLHSFMSVVADLASGSLDYIFRCRVKPKPHFDPCSPDDDLIVSSALLGWA